MPAYSAPLSSRLMRAALFGAAGLCALALLAVLAFLVLVDPSQYKPQLVAALQQATGRAVAINGSVDLLPSLTPTVTINDITLANVVDGSQPQMASARRIEAQVELLPLLTGHVVIDRLVLVQPKLLLERDALGRGNWNFVRSPARSTAALSTAALSTPGQPTGGTAAAAAPAPIASRRVTIEAVNIRDGEIRWHPSAVAPVTTIGITRLDAGAPSTTTPVTVKGDIAVNGVATAILMSTGPLAPILNGTDAADWPVKLSLITDAAHVTANGTVSRPAAARGYRLDIEASAPDLTALKPMLNLTLPPLRDVGLTTTLSDDDTGSPRLSAIKMHTGASSLDGIRSGLAVSRAELSADALTTPMTINFHGSFRREPLVVIGTLGTLAALAAPDRTDDVAFDLTADLAKSHLKASGEVGVPADLADVRATVSATVPDLAALGDLIDQKLPALQDVKFGTEIKDAGGGLDRGIALSTASLQASIGDLSGDATILYADKPRITGRVNSTSFDLDGLLAALGTAGPPPPPPVEPVALPPPRPSAVSSPGGGPPVVIPPPPPLPRLLFSARPLRLDALQAADLDIDATVATLRVRAVTLHDVAGHLVLHDQRLRFDPARATTPGGKITGELSVDGIDPAKPAIIHLHAPALELAPLLIQFGAPNVASGTADVTVMLRGSSRSPHDLASDAVGRISVTMVDGAVSNAVLADILGDALHTARVGEVVDPNGQTKLRCLAARADFNRGSAVLSAFLLDTTHVMLRGEGTATMGDEALSLRLQATQHGGGVMVPLRVTGTLGGPKVAIDTTAGTQVALGAILGRAIPQAAARAAQTVAETAGDPCPPALAAARGETPEGTAPHGPAAHDPPAGPAAGQPPKLPNSAQILRSLVR